MKRQGKILAITLSALSAAAMCASLAGCGGLEVNGPEYNYKLVPSTETYEFTGEVISTVVPDAEIKIDGKFDEDFYTNRSWFKGNKISGEEKGTLKMTTYFGKTGILVAARIEDSRVAFHSNTIATGNITCFNGYFAFGNAKVQSDGVYEVECTAGNRFKISQFTPTGLKVLRTELDKTPVSAVMREGDILKGECYNYQVEYFMPYSLFGRDSRPSSVYFNPTMISSTLDEYGAVDDRNWYNFGYQQSPQISGWGNPNQGYVFDNNGFVNNRISINASGGTVQEEWGYDWCLTGDQVNFNVKPDDGKTLKSITVNGVERKSAVKNGKLAVICKGDIAVVAEFVDEASIAPQCNSTVIVYAKDGTTKTDLPSDAKLVMTDRDDSSKHYEVALTKTGTGTYTFEGEFRPGHYNLSLSVEGYTCASAGKDESNSSTTQLWIDELGGQLWGVTFTQSD